LPFIKFIVNVVIVESLTVGIVTVPFVELKNFETVFPISIEKSKGLPQEAHLHDNFRFCPNLNEIKGVPDEDVRQFPKDEKMNELTPPIVKTEDNL
jgi:hypothetical protein